MSCSVSELRCLPCSSPSSSTSAHGGTFPHRRRRVGGAHRPDRAATYGCGGLQTRPVLGSDPQAVRIFALVLVLYGIGETMFGNWGTTLLVSKGVNATSATDALGAFWAAVTVGRLVIALSGRWICSTTVYRVLPWAMAVALLVAPAEKNLRQASCCSSSAAWPVPASFPSPSATARRRFRRMWSWQRDGLSPPISSATDWRRSGAES